MSKREALAIVGAWPLWRLITHGAAWGVGFGLLASFWLARVFNNPVIEITITLTTAYLAFFSAEVIGCSGVLAVVALGLFMGKEGKVSISPEVGHFLQEFWEMMAVWPAPNAPHPHAPTRPRAPPHRERRTPHGHLRPIPSSSSHPHPVSTLYMAVHRQHGHLRHHGHRDDVQT